LPYQWQDVAAIGAIGMGISVEKDIKQRGSRMMGVYEP